LAKTVIRGTGRKNGFEEKNALKTTFKGNISLKHFYVEKRWYDV